MHAIVAPAVTIKSCDGEDNDRQARWGKGNYRVAELTKSQLSREDKLDSCMD